MIFKPKSWLWKLTFPFAHDNFTAIGDTIYHPKERIPTQSVIAHESIHFRQQRETGLFKFVVLYLFCLPVLWNPWRWRWEWEAYRDGSKLTSEQTQKKLNSYAYGWLRHKEATT